jgi:resuscitation-promoting factor RpfB
MPGRINGFSLAYTGVGAVVMWSGIKGWSLTSTFRSLLSGKAPTTTTEPITGSSSSTGSSTPAAAGDTGASNAGAAANQAIAKLLAAPYGWSTGTQWDDLVSLWNRESGWSNTADNLSSGAYGIAQALPPTKYPAAGQASGGSSASAQISWGLQYIQETYGSPEAAWAHEESAGWY